MPGKNLKSLEDSFHKSTLRRSPRFLLLSQIYGEQSNSKENQVCFPKISSLDKQTSSTEVVSPKESRNRRQPLRIIDSANGSRKHAASMGSRNSSPGFSTPKEAPKNASEKCRVENFRFSEKRVVSEVSSKSVCKNDRRRSLRLMGFRMGDVDFSSSSWGQMSRKGECREERWRSRRLMHCAKAGELAHDVSLKVSEKGDGRNERRRSLRLMGFEKGSSFTSGSLEEKICREASQNGNESNSRRRSLRLMGCKKQEEILSDFCNKEKPLRRNQKGELPMEQRHSVGWKGLAESVVSAFSFSIKYGRSQSGESVGSQRDIHNFSKECVSFIKSPLGMLSESKELGMETGKEVMVDENVVAAVVTSLKEGTKKKRKELGSGSADNGMFERGYEEQQGLDGWTKCQEAALERAYFSAKPSPHFWKKVAKLVPGKSAQDCFDRIHANLATPKVQPRLRSHKSNSFPSGDSPLSSGKLLENIDPNVKKTKRSRQKRLVAQKMVRKMLTKHHIADKGYEVDLFSVLEAAGDASSQDPSQDNMPSTPDCVLKPLGFLQKCPLQSSSAHRNSLSKLKTVISGDLTSPPVLKPVKNKALHEKYIDQLHSREARRKRAASAQGKGLNAVNMHAKGSGMLENDVKSARTALVSDAMDVIRQFKEMQSVDMSDYQYLSNEDDADADDNCEDGP